MRLLAVNSLRPGMILGKKIYNEDGLVLLAEQVELNDRIIKRLDEMGIAYVYIQDPQTDDIDIPDMIQEQTRQKALQEIRNQFRKISGTSLQRSVSHLGKAFGGVMESILDDIGSRQDTMILLNDLGGTDQNLYQHSLTVCLYTLVLGKANGYTRQQLLELGIGSLLHDIGKTQLPSSILLKPGKLTREEYLEIQTHTLLGYRILKKEPDISQLSALCALQHHERIDGTGYPNGLVNREIHDYAKWVSLADSYDAMTANRSYRAPLLPHQAVEVLYSGAGTLYEQYMLEKFRDRVAIYPLGLPVVLSTGEEGVVVRIDPRIPHRPVIRILKDRDGQELAAPHEMDLSKVLSVIITEAGGVKKAEENAR
ncbi:HD-GYP domain-containing protein [Paenibacillus sp. P96]|uniref:HD-GYP domain-containing protein n=1 Tax=Paenibacillus zeirhizosphaerae TaxID=2987519 RepID=A0ABT9FT60_9BACL|nr:HD-GYP domain-containing protein [Paenibacillus sp. P96]MDP4097924.1 HD-GYP domain-containing protein [Paenibacillus sp. P96]